MARPEVRTVILFEDQAQETFLRRLVKRLGLRPERYQNCRNNVGVLQQLGVEVDALRERNFQKNVGLIVMIDADNKGLQGRVSELLSRIETDASDGARKSGERIALVVPAREIENWYVHLCVPAARPIDEGKDYKPTKEWRELEKDLGAAAKQAIDAWAPEAGRVDPPSLMAARVELDRVQ
ncbi:MAG: hypothetical protein ABJE95_01695 [Byssovorax sp.]